MTKVLDDLPEMAECYSTDYCTAIELAYGKNMLSERGEQGFEEMAAVVDFAGKQVLDFGTGFGSGAQYFAQQGAHVLGVDILPDIVKQAQERLPKELASRVEFKAYDGVKLSSEANTFDIIVCKGVLVHIDPADRMAFFADLLRVLKPGGVLLIDCWFTKKDNEWSGPLKDMMEAESLVLYAQTEATTRKMLGDAGFANSVFTNNAQAHVQFFDSVEARLKKSQVKRSFLKLYDEDVYQEHIQSYKDIAQANRNGDLTCGLIRAHKPQ